MPLYRRDLDLVAQASDGTLAAFATVWYDDACRFGYFEPVGVDPAHQRRGLGRALLCAGLHRLRERGACVAQVSGYSHAANALYGSVMGGEPTCYARWQRTWA
jgi:ribosomal protein S18 acetylase RimI-like enzyme